MSELNNSQSDESMDDGWDREAREYASQRERLSDPPTPPAPSLRSPLPLKQAPSKTAFNGPSQGPMDHPLHFPAAVSRSALFSAGRSSLAAASTKVAATSAIARQGGEGYRLEGPRLDMSDKIVWEAVVRLIKSQERDSDGYARLSLRECAALMGWRDRGGKTLRWIEQRIDRLRAAKIDFGGAGPLPMIRLITGEAGEARVGLASTLTEHLLSEGPQARAYPERRATLATTLAKWTHDLLSTHSEPRDLTVGYLRSLSGYDGQDRRFPSQLIAALQEIQTAAPELLAAFEIDRSRKSSDLWTLRWKRGAEKVDYFVPKKTEARMASGRKRGGVAL